MIRTFSICVVGLLVLSNVPRLAHAADSHQWTVGLIVSAGAATIADTDDHDSIGTGDVIAGVVDGQPVDIVDGRLEDEEFDLPVAAIGLTVGRRIGQWNLQLETLWRYRTDWNLTAPTPSIRTVTNVVSNVETASWLVNVSRIGQINRYWSWQLGAGVGVVTNKLESLYIEREEPGVSPERVFADDNSSTDLCWNLLAGVRFDFSGPWSFNVNYRYIDLGDLDAGPFPSRNAKVSGKHLSHEMLLSMQRDL